MILMLFETTLYCAASNYEPPHLSSRIAGAPPPGYVTFRRIYIDIKKIIAGVRFVKIV
jgi:hypothetical protein